MKSCKPCPRLEDDGQQHDDQHEDAGNEQRSLVDPAASSQLLGRELSELLLHRCSLAVGLPPTMTRGLAPRQGTDRRCSTPGRGLGDTETLASETHGPGLTTHGHSSGAELETLTETNAHGRSVVVGV